MLFEKSFKIIIFIIVLTNVGAIAQLGERLNGIQKVIGSNPFSSTNFPAKEMYYVYILLSRSTGKYYCGSTENLERRIHQHNYGYSKSTKSGIPWILKYSEEYDDRSSAVRRESEIKKKKSRAFIEKLIFEGESVPNEIREGHRFEPV